MVQLENMDGAIRFTGPDARTFLQGQLTQDLQLLTPGNTVLAAFLTPQGRVIAVLELTEDADGVLARLPASMAELTLTKLKRYVLRAKVTMTNVTSAAALDAEAHNAQRLRDIAAGRPQVYPETTEAFIAQMLNLDVLDGISFNKGCYTGQEIVARAHYRGKVKRRMQRFRTHESLALEPGAEGRFADGRSFKVVHSALAPDGYREFLAVTTTAVTNAMEAGDDENAAAPGETQPIVAEALPLPYALPE